MLGAWHYLTYLETGRAKGTEMNMVGGAEDRLSLLISNQGEGEIYLQHR